MRLFWLVFKQCADRLKFAHFLLDEPFYFLLVSYFTLVIAISESTL